MGDKGGAQEEWAHCNSCRRSTKHDVLASRNREAYEADGTLDHVTTYDMLVCRGCEGIALRLTESYYGQEDVTFYPPRISRSTPEWFRDFRFREMMKEEDQLSSLMWEVYSALHAGSHRLAMMGARALVDVMMTDKLGDIGGFEDKLRKLADLGFVSQKNADFLRAALDAGHAAAHRGHFPTSKEINQVMDIVENVIQAVYVLEGEADALSKSTPPRKRTEGNDDS